MAVNQVLDLRGMIFPLDLLQLKNRLDAMKKGDPLEVILNDAEVAKHITLLIQRSDDHLIFYKTAKIVFVLEYKRGEGSQPIRIPGNSEADNWIKINS